MSDANELEARLARLVKESEARLRGRATARAVEMEGLSERLGRFAAVSRDWVECAILPRLRTLAGGFPGAKAAVAAGCTGAKVEFAATDEYPASAEASVSLAHDAAADKVHVLFQARIIPILAQYEKEGALEMPLDGADRSRLERFLDDRICLFAETYLRIREPDSPYQKEQTVVDPVCGMALRRWEAVATVQHDRGTYYFCVDKCRRLFEADPERYVGGRGRA
ncbi:MAG: YHS domain-containing protein [Planctomycetes bacterium]|nr:YHS domain-containing protein [Planctomycetota bacterium]